MVDNVINSYKWGNAALGTSGGIVNWSFATSSRPTGYQFDRFIVETSFQALVRDAFDAWEAIANIDFVEVADNAAAVFRLGWDAIDGPSNQVGEAQTAWSFQPGDTRFSLSTAEIRFDTAETWSTSKANSANNETNFYAVALHEIGHAIGLDHTDNQTTIMFPTLTTQNSLAAGDISGAQLIYGSNVLTNPGGATSGNDVISGTSANDFIDALAGSDTVVFTGARDNYAIFSNSQGQTIVADAVANRDGKDTLQNVEFLSFGGQSISTANALVEPADADNSNYQVYRFYNSQTGSHFFTTSLAERNSVIETLDVMSYEGNAFDSNVTDVNGTAVFRFFNLSNNVHFYTADGKEAAGLRQNAGFRDEGISYYASDDASNGGTALFRFFNTQNGSHFYTVSEAERDNIINTLGHYNYEGTAFYVDLA